MPNLRNKTVVLTGASSGFGRGAAIEYARRGANLVLAARRKNLLKAVADECKRRGVKAVVVETDVSDPDQVQKLADTAISKFGKIDIWVNDAGVSTMGRYDEIPLDEHEQVIETNLLGTMYGSYEAIKHFRKQGSGTLINIGSYLSKGSAPYQAAYVASKHGVRGLSTAIRQELEADGLDRIHVCTIMPTSMDTPFFEHAGQHTGHPNRPATPVYDPSLVVDAIIRVSLEPEPEVMVGRSAKVAGLFGKVAPLLLERLMAAKMRRRVYGHSERERQHTGSVYEPMEEGRGLRGGWLDEEGNVREPDERPEKKSHVGTVVTIVGSLGIIGYALTRRRQMLARKAA